MSIRQSIIAAGVACLLAAPSVASAGIRDERPNLIGGEILGRGVAVTANYERFVTNQFGLGAGVMAFGASGGGVSIIPLYFSYVPLDAHSPYVSVGGTILAGGGDLNDWESTWLTHVTVGYQYTSAGGFFLRPFFTYLRPSQRGGGDEYMIWPGVTVGGSF